MVEIPDKEFGKLQARLKEMENTVNEHKQEQKRLELALSILQEMNSPAKTKDLIHKILGLIKESTGFEAVGIRMREGEDFPYYVTIGFPERFFEAGKYLFSRNQDGETVFDPQDDPLLECMCRNVLCSRTDPSLPFFTERGSFWTNSMSNLLTSSSEMDLQGPARNRCKGESYESVAIIPLLSGDETIGLLQLNDKRHDLLTADMVRFFEGIGSSISIAMGKIKVEETIRQSDEKIKALLNATSDIAFLIDSEGILLALNEAAARTLGKSLNELIGRNIYAFLPESEARSRKEWINKVIASGMVQRRETFFFEKVYESITFPILDIKGKVIELAVYSHDITDHRKAQEALRESEKRLAEAQRISSLGCWTWDIATGNVIWSEETKKIFGYQPEMGILNVELYMKFIHPEDREIMRTYAETILTEGVAPDVEYRILRGDGESRVVLMRSEGIFDASGKLVELKGTIQDITERKRAEEAIQESERKYRRLFEYSNDIIVQVNRFGKVVAVNNKLIETLGFTPEEIIGKYFFNLGILEIKELPGIVKQFKNAVIEGMIEDNTGKFLNKLELKMKAKNGKKIFIEANTTILRKDEKIEGFLSNLRDITERKQAEEEIKNSLREKEVLLKEIHHRVKNNLQIVSSLLYLQSKKVADPQSLEVFNEGQNRIRSMVLIHEQLYRSSDLARINFEKYIYDITYSLSHSYGSNPVIYNIQAEGIYLGVDQAIPCGLIINELISNAHKYAFQGKQGQIDIFFRIDNSNYLTLTVKDNGIGFPKDLDFRNTTSLGLQIVNKLVNQLEGNIELHSDNGTEFIIKFPA